MSDFDVDRHTLFLGLSGSHAYGLARPESDVDVRGCALPPREVRESFFRTFEQFGATDQREPWGPNARRALAVLERHPTGGPSYRLHGQLDLAIFGLAKLFRLGANNNPNILELLFLEDSELLFCTPAWERLLAERDRFLSRRCRLTYTGYAHSQLKRIQGHRRWLLDPPRRPPTREEFGLPEQSLLPGDERAQIDAAIEKKLGEWFLEDSVDGRISGAELDVLRERMKEFYSAALSCPEEELEDRAYVAAGAALGLSRDVLHLLAQERRYRAARKHWKQYQRWREERNPQRACLEEKHGYDTKHGAHLIRLMRTGLEVLREGRLRVRRPDADELRALRDGALSYDRLMEEASRIEREMEEASAGSALPAAPDLEGLDGLMLRVMDAFFGGI